MRKRQKLYGKRFSIYAKRNKYQAWSEWTQTNDFEFAMIHVKKIRELGFFAKVVDRRGKREVLADGS